MTTIADHIRRRRRNTLMAEQQYDEVLQPYVDTGALAGAVAVVADGSQVIGSSAVGWADIAAREPMRPNTLFWIASQTKSITAVALMMLVEEGRVDLDNPVEEYLPAFQDPWVIEEQDDVHILLRKAERPVTVRDLLRHTSGIGAPLKPILEESKLDRLSLEEAIRGYSLTPLRFQPGSQYQYSNPGINTAGRIIEVVSGVPYAEFLQRRLLDPLGMSDTTFWPTAEQQRRLAKSYRPNAARDGLEETRIAYLQYPLDDLARQPYPGGGLFSTAHDLMRFCQMILNGGRDESQTYLSPDSIAEMTRKQTGDAIEASYGLGWDVGPQTYGHGGAYATQMTIHDARKLITIFLVQHDGFPLDGDKCRDAFVTAAIKNP